MEDLKIVYWMELKNELTWSKVETSLEFLIRRAVEIEDYLLFDKFSNLNIFLDDMKTNEEIRVFF